MSRLLDICRQALVYDSIQALTAGLRAMASDGDVVLVRVKNRMRVGQPAEETAGYRDVAVNLRIVTAETCRLGVETHIAEVQLVLRPMADIKVLTAARDVGHGTLSVTPVPHQLCRDCRFRAGHEQLGRCFWHCSWSNVSCSRVVHAVCKACTYQVNAHCWAWHCCVEWGRAGP